MKIFVSYMQMTFGVLMLTELHKHFSVLLPVFAATQVVSDGGVTVAIYLTRGLQCFE